MLFRILWILLPMFTGCATTSSISSKTDQEQVLDKQHFIDTVTIKDDSLDIIATLSTKNGYQKKYKYNSKFVSDNFLRAFLNKKTGDSSYQLYQIIQYQGKGWHRFNRCNFQTPEGVISKPVIVIDRDVECSKYTCTYTEHIAIGLDKKLLEDLSGNIVPWRFKFLAKSGSQHQGWMRLEEIDGLREKVEQYYGYFR